MQAKGVNIIIQVWSDELAHVAQTYADKCYFGHNNLRNEEQKTFPYVGENLYITSSPTPDLASIVKGWYDEHHDYNYQENTCSPHKVCGHYTQVYRLTRKLCLLICI